MSWKHLRYKWFGVRWALIRLDTSDAKILAMAKRAIEEKSAVLLYSGEWMLQHHNQLAQDRGRITQEETPSAAATPEPTDTPAFEWLQGAVRNGYMITMQSGGRLLLDPPEPTPTEPQEEGWELLRLVMRTRKEDASLQSAKRKLTDRLSQRGVGVFFIDTRSQPAQPEETPTEPTDDTTNDK